jgi:hypothetical protein
MQIWIWWSIMLLNSTINIYLWNIKRNKLSFFYIFVNIYRSTFPIIHTNNTCLFIYSSPFIERSLSTIAELIFVIQLTNWFKLYYEYKLHIILCIIIAEISCWCGIITGNMNWHIIEESIWCYSAIILLMLLNFSNENIILYRNFQTKLILYCYILYMITYDIPLYISKSNVEKTQYFLCENISADYNIWKPYLFWMTGYFTFGSWIVLAIS